MGVKQIVLTPSQSKRLIGMGVSSFGPVRERMESGIIVVTKGTTNRYVAEELLGIDLSRYPFAWGVVNSPKARRDKDDIGEIVIVDGEMTEMDLSQATSSLSTGDIYIKGGNALDYRAGKVGILSTSPVGGTIGKAYAKVIGTRVRLILPIGLEKCISTPVDTASQMLGSPDIQATGLPTMYPVRGDIFTEIEALKEVLGEVQVHHVASGGISDYQGAVRLLVRGDDEAIGLLEKIEKRLSREPQYRG